MLNTGVKTMLPSRRRLLQKLLQLRHTPSCCPSYGAASCSRLVLGIETSCDDTGAAVLDEKGAILGESLHSQKEVHLRSVSKELHSFRKMRDTFVFSPSNL